MQPDRVCAFRLRLPSNAEGHTQPGESQCDHDSTVGQQLFSMTLCHAAAGINIALYVCAIRSFSHQIWEPLRPRPYDMQAAAGEGCIPHHACLQLISSLRLGNVYYTQEATNRLAAVDLPGMTEQAYLTQLEERWQPDTQLLTGLCEHVAGKGWLAALQWLRQKGAPWDNFTCSAAARGGHIAVLQWAHSQGCPWSSEVNDIWDAARSGQQAILQWARQQGIRKFVERWSCNFAAFAGQMATLQCMRKHGWDWDCRVCAYAAVGGQLAILQWVHNQGCAWDVRTCTYAAKCGDLAMLRWAHEHGCPWTEDTTQEALQERRLNTYLWARRNGCPSSVTTEASAQCIVKALTISYLVLRSAAPSQVPHEVLRSIVMNGHEVD